MTANASAFPVLHFTGEDKEIGRLWSKGGKLEFEGNASEAAHQLFEHVIKENNGYLHLVEEQNNQLHAELLAMEHDRDHWKNNHDHQVEIARSLKARKDMPIDRVLLHDALSALGLEGAARTPAAKGVVTNVETLDHVLDVYEAARKLVHCKGRYHSELNYKALAALFGVQHLPQPVTPEITPEQEAAMQELTDLTQQLEDNLIVVSPEAFDKVQQLIDAPAEPTDALRELMTSKPKYERRF
ncbi:hypothetical protein ACVOZ6_003441 [Escherichia coli]